MNRGRRRILRGTVGPEVFVGPLPEDEINDTESVMDQPYEQQAAAVAPPVQQRPPAQASVVSNSRSVVSVVADISNVKELARITVKDFIKLKAEIDSAERRGMTVYRNEFIPKHMKLAIHRQVESTGTNESWYTGVNCWRTLDDRTFFDVIPNLFIPQGLSMDARLVAAVEKLRFKMSDDFSEAFLLESKLNELLYECGYKNDLDDFTEEDSAPSELRKIVQLLILRNLDKGSAPEGAISGIK